jgi:hypothetical protein
LDSSACGVHGVVRRDDYGHGPAAGGGITATLAQYSGSMPQSTLRRSQYGQPIMRNP